jgi:hypothetical protein
MSSGEPAIKIRLKTFDLSQHEVTQKISQGSVRGVFDNAKASAEGSLARQNTCLLASHSSPCHHHCSQSSPASPARCATMTASIRIIFVLEAHHQREIIYFRWCRICTRRYFARVCLQTCPSLHLACRNTNSGSQPCRSTRV